ncbi:Ldh family oxidoreductase [Bacillus cereus]|nr:Ldh family oxidoreductase [Bacillus cereus]
MKQLLNNKVIKIDILKEFVESVLRSVNVSKSDAQIAADVIVTAEIRGIYSHGFARILPFYLPLILDNIVQLKNKPSITFSNPIIKYIDAKKSLGFSTSYNAMNYSIENAKNFGVGVTFVTDSTHFGIASYYSMMATKNNLIGITLSNGSPAVVAPGGKESFLGTNAVSIAFPRDNKMPLVLDLGLSITSLGNLFLEIEKGNKVPAHWAAASFLKKHNISPTSTIDPNILYENRMLAPLGAGDKKGEYKGFQLGLLIDLFIGLLGGGKFSFEQSKGEANQIFIAVDPNMCNGICTYNDAICRLEEQFLNYEVIEGYENLRIPGKRSNQLENIANIKGLEIDSRLEKILSDISKQTGVSIEF